MAMHGLIKDFMQKKIILQILSKFSSLETLLEVHLDWIVEIQTYIESCTWHNNGIWCIHFIILI